MRSGSERRTSPRIGLLLTLSLVACAAPGTSPSSGAVETTGSLTPSPLVTAESERPAPSEPATACLDQVVPDSPGLVSGSFAQVVTNDLVMRNAPRVADDSRIEGTLDAPARVYVNAGPVDANGYEWWEVIPEGGNNDNAAWVAAAGKDGEEWLQASPRREGTWTVIERRDVLGRVPAAGRVGTGADGRLYFFGGTTGTALDQQAIDLALAYDPGTCEWDDLPALPKVSEGLHVAQTPDGTFHAIGPKWDPSRDVPRALHFAFDPTRQAWEVRDPVPGDVGFGTTLATDGQGRLWAFGDTIHRYDAGSDSWASVSTPPDWGHGVDGATLWPDGRLALLLPGAGGIRLFDPESGSAPPITWPRVARYNARMAALEDGTLVISGGYLTGSCTVGELPPEVPPSPHYTLVDTYSPATGRWLSITPPKLGGTELAPVVVDGVLYVIGLDQRMTSSGSDPVVEEVELVIARFTPADAMAGHTAEPGRGGCGG